MQQKSASKTEAKHKGLDTSSRSGGLSPKYLTARRAAEVYGVHRDFFRKTPDLRRWRVVVNAKTHLYPVDKLDEFFSKLRVG